MIHTEKEGKVMSSLQGLYQSELNQRSRMNIKEFVYRDVTLCD